MRALGAHDWSGSRSKTKLPLQFGVPGQFCLNFVEVLALVNKVGVVFEVRMSLLALVLQNRV